MSTAAPRPTRGLLAALVVAASLLTGFLLAPGDARAARGMELAIQDDSLFVQGNKRFKGNKAFDYAKQLGVTRIRVNLLWAYTMPRQQYSARRKPATINYDFTQIDRLIDRAASNGIRIHLSLTGPAPKWANAKRAGTTKAWFKPNAAQFGQFARVAATHFKGRVDRYSIWNEPNWKTWLGPLKSAPALYRAMYVRAYSAIKTADPRAKVLIGETSPYGRPGLSTAPLAFLRKVTCVNSNYKRAAKCPKLKADGYAHHPYDFRHAPNYEYPGADNVTIGTLSRLTRALDRLRSSGQLRTPGGGRMPLYLTEYGYFASGKRALPSEDAVALPEAGVHDRPPQRPREEPDAVPAADASARLGLDVQHGARVPQRQAPPAVQRAARLVPLEPRPGQEPGPVVLGPAGAGEPDRLRH